MTTNHQRMEGGGLWYLEVLYEITSFKIERLCGQTVKSILFTEVQLSEAELEVLNSVELLSIPKPKSLFASLYR